MFNRANDRAGDTVVLTWAAEARKEAAAQQLLTSYIVDDNDKAWVRTTLCLQLNNNAIEYAITYK